MIKDETVFILGAGASRPYGFPTGKELREIILRNFLSEYAKFGEQLRVFEAKNFINSFKLSSNESIDIFLSRNPEFSEFGKLAIVSSIAECERNSKFREEMKKEFKAEDWYTYIFNELINEIKKKNDYKKISENNITIITFNYDRSLEHFLYESFRHSFSGISEEAISLALSKIKIFHVYGRVAPLPWQDKGCGIEYGSLKAGEVPSVIQNIKVVGEDREDINTIVKQKIIQNAKKIFFLGFGFASENLEVLNIPNVLRTKHQIFATAKGLLKEELDSIISWNIIDNFDDDPSEDRPQYKYIKIEIYATCKEILRKYLHYFDEEYEQEYG